MTVYNETIIFEDASYDNWIAYMKQVHIPAVMNTGYFDSYKILNVIDSPNEGVTTCVQYNTDSEERFAQFYNQHLHALHSSHHEIYENKYVLYSSLMETIAEG